MRLKMSLKFNDGDLKFNKNNKKRSRYFKRKAKASFQRKTADNNNKNKQGWLLP